MNKVTDLTKVIEEREALKNVQRIFDEMMDIDQKERIIYQNKQTDGLKVVSIKPVENESFNPDDIDFGDL